MDRGILAALLRDADQHITERRLQIDRYKIQIDELEGDGHSATDVRDAVDRLEKALLLYIEHRSQLAKDLES